MTVEYTIPIRVYYEDTNAVEIVYYGNYLRFMERRRTEWLRHIGFDIHSVTEHFGVIPAAQSAKLRFLKPIRLSDLLSVSMAIERCGRASLQIRQEIHCGEERLFHGVVKLAILDATRFRPRPIPYEILEGINTWKMP